MVNKFLGYVLLGTFPIITLLMILTVILQIENETTVDIGDWLAFSGGIIGAILAVGGVYWATQKQTRKAQEALEFEQRKHHLEESKNSEISALIITVSLDEYQRRLSEFRTSIQSLSILLAEGEQALDTPQKLGKIGRDIKARFNNRSHINIYDLAKYIADIPAEIKSEILETINNERTLYQKINLVFMGCDITVNTKDEQLDSLKMLAIHTSSAEKFIKTNSDKNNEILGKLQNLINVENNPE
ncbi:hypothetical protein [Kiloniella sp.]|uniref:hypothetical protein n=1 Tax=Kiloniella sp. TaxID=1938587 RepID=UPI003B0165CD